MAWLRRLLNRRGIYDDLSEEIQQHLAEKVDALMAEGLSREEAEHEARRVFGNVTLTEESGREVWRWAAVENLLLQGRFAARRLWKSPGFAATAMLTLALGIGTNIVVFSVLNGLLLRPLDVPDPENVFLVAHGIQGKPAWSAHSYRDYQDFRDRDESFQGLAAYSFIRAGLYVGDASIRSWGHSVSGNYFDVLQVQPTLGRFFHASDEHGPGSVPYIVLNYDFWKREFARDPNIVGKTIGVNQHTFTVIGVAPEGFHGIDSVLWPDYWIPLLNADQVNGSDDLPYRDHYYVMVFGRLKPGMTPELATHQLDRIAAQMAKEDRKDDGLATEVIPPRFAYDTNHSAEKALMGMMLLAALVLVAACTNLASIFGVRAADRSGELAIRLAIGSSSWGIVKELLIEALLVSIVGGVVGTLMASVVLRGLTQWQPFDFPTRFVLAPDVRVYAVALALSLASGLVFGLLPARRVSRMDPMDAIKSGTLQVGSFRRFALRDLLLASQIAVCTLLVTASFVAAAGMRRTLRVPLGFRPEGVTLAMADLRMAGYTGKSTIALEKRLLEEAGKLPGVSGAAVADGVPLRGGASWFIYREGTTEFLPAHMEFPTATFQISPGYFAAAGTEFLAGRDFTWHDDESKPFIAIVNETFARKLYGTTSAVVGRRFAMWETARYEIVGVVQNGKYNALDEDEQPAMFVPLMQGVGGVMSGNAALIVRSALPGGQMASELNRAVRSVEPRAPFQLESWGDEVDRAMLQARTAATVLGIMGLLAAVLAITGIFGMASYCVSKRMREQGIRVALGAQRVQLMGSTFGRPFALFASGLTIGLGLGVMTARVLGHIVSYATPRDPVVVMQVVAAMIVLGIVAIAIPARRVLATDPARLLREL